MNKDYFLEAMNEISDSHIIEAVSYEPKEKTVKWKKILPFAACVVLVAVASFAVNNMKSAVEPTTAYQDSTFSATNAPTTAVLDNDTTTTQPTTVAGSTEISQEPSAPTIAYAPPKESDTVAGTTMSATTSLKWEQRSYAQCYPDLQFNKLSYTTRQGSLIGEEKLSGLIGTATLTGKDDGGKEHTVNADVYGIKGVQTKCAVALYFKDGVQQQLSAQGFYVYEGRDYIPENLGKAVEELNIKEHMSFDSMYIYYDAYDVKGYSGLAETRTYYMNEKIEAAFLSLLEDAGALKGEVYDYDSTVAAENINLFCRYLGGTVRFCLNSDGYLIFGSYNNSLRYSIGKDAFNCFRNTLEAEGELRNNTSGLVTTTSSTTSQGIAY